MVVIDENYEIEDFADLVVKDIQHSTLGAVFTDSLGVEWTYFGQKRSDRWSFSVVLVAGILLRNVKLTSEANGFTVFDVDASGHARLRIDVVFRRGGGRVQTVTLLLPGGKPMIYG